MQCKAQRKGPPKTFFYRAVIGRWRGPIPFVRPAFTAFCTFRPRFLSYGVIVCVRCQSRREPKSYHNETPQKKTDD